MTEVETFLAGMAGDINGLMDTRRQHSRIDLEVQTLDTQNQPYSPARTQTTSLLISHQSQHNATLFYVHNIQRSNQNVQVTTTTFIPLGQNTYTNPKGPQ